MNKNRTIYRSLTQLLAVAGCIACVGCWGKAPPPSTSAIAAGLATIDGQPITGGMITLVSAENPRKRATGILRPDGTFRLAGSPIGESYVIIDTTSVQMGDPSAYMPLPRKYSRLETTDVTVELQPGENTDVAIRCESL